MSARSWIVRKVIKWLWAKYPGQVKDIVLGPKAHVHRNPTKKPQFDMRSPIDQATGYPSVGPGEMKRKICAAILG